MRFHRLFRSLCLCLLLGSAGALADQVEYVVTGVDEPMLGNVRKHVTTFRIGNTAKLNARLRRTMTEQAIESAFLLAPGGEFAFITIGLGLAGGLIHPELASVMLAVTTLSMLLIPAMDVAGRRLAEHPEPAQADGLPAALKSPEFSDHYPRMIVVGYGRVGRLVSELLESHAIPYLVIDHFAPVVTQGHYNGKPIYFGNAADTHFLRQCGIDHADAVVLTINRASESELIVTAVRQLRADVPIIVRARDSDHARRLYEMGATDAVPETIEASLQLSEAALVSVGVPTGPVIASIHEKRDEFRAVLQGHGGYPGQAGARGQRGAPPPEDINEPPRPATGTETSRTPAGTEGR